MITNKVLILVITALGGKSYWSRMIMVLLELLNKIIYLFSLFSKQK